MKTILLPFLALAIPVGAAAQERVGLTNTLNALVLTPCGQILVTGQFIGSSDTDNVTIQPKEKQSSITVLELELVAEIDAAKAEPSLVPYSYSTDDHSCPYGVSVSYGDQTVLTGLSVAQAAPARASE